MDRTPPKTRLRDSRLVGGLLSFAGGAMHLLANLLGKQ